MTIKEYNICVKDYSDHVYRFVRKHIRNEMSSKDIVQETFLKVWERYEDIQFDKAKSYLFTTAYNLTINFIKREKKSSSDEILDNRLINVNTSNFDLKEVLDLALERLPEIQKTVILLRDYEGYNYSEISEITNLSESQVKVYIFRARQSLKKYLVNIDLVA